MGKIHKMPKITELAGQLDTELAREPFDADHLLFLLEQISQQMCTPQGCEDLNDLVFDLIPPFIHAAGKSKACEDAVKQLLGAAAAENCVSPREVYSALAAALSDSMQHIGIDQSTALGASSLEFQSSCLLENLTHSLLRLKKLSTAFLREHLLLATTWCHYAQEEDNDNEEEDTRNKGEEGFCKSIAQLIKAVAVQREKEEQKTNRQILLQSILDVTGSALELPRRLDNATEAAQAILLEAQSTISNKLLRFQPLVLKLLAEGPERILVVLCQAPAQFGVNTLEDLLESVELDKEMHGGEALGAAAAVCCTILRSIGPGTVGGGGEKSLWYLECSSCSTNKMLSYVSMALHTLTDAAAQHHSVPLALLPLVVVAQFSKLRRSNDTPLDEGSVSLTLPIISSLVSVMSLNPVEIVRTCAYEALHSLVDAMVPQARYRVLQNMIRTNSSSSGSATALIAAVALQRLRLEISPAVVQEPFTQTTSLQLALPWIQKSAHPPSWENEEDVLHNADVLAAALSVVRLVLLQRLAMNRNVEEREDISEQFRAENLENLVVDHLKPLQTYTTNLIHRIKSSNTNADLEVYLALQRLEEVLDRTVEAAHELY
jgi:hypothetical protein